MITPTAPLNAQSSIPLVGFGTYLIRNDSASAAVQAALAAGYRHIDTAEAYQNEAGVGAGIRAAAETSGLRREDVFVTTKLWPGNAAWGMAPKGYASTLESFDASLERLGLSYVDLYLVHAPFNPEHRLDVWRALVELKRQGRARAIGVSNFSVAHIEEIRAASLPTPDANQIELHPWSQKPALVAYLKHHGILPIAYSSLLPLSTWREAPGQASAKTEAMRVDGSRDGSPFKAMAAKYRVSEAQVLLRWAVQLGYPVLPKSTSPERIRANIDLFSFELDAADMASISTMDRGEGKAWPSGDPSMTN